MAVYRTRYIRGLWAIDRWGRAYLRRGWLWVLAAIVVLVNAIVLVVDVARGSQPLGFLLAALVLFALTGWLMSRAHSLARRELDKNVQSGSVR